CVPGSPNLENLSHDMPDNTLWFCDLFVYWLQRWLQPKSRLSLGFPQSEIIRYHGYPSEEYEVTTKDGYILGVFRIPAGRNSRNTGKKPAVLLHHGTLGDCIHWISNLPNNSLGFLLADAGYDVWMGNSRGNTWSLKHKTLKPSQKEFWQFSFDEIGKYDILAELCFIMNKTGQKDVYYIGTSEAAAAGFIALYTYPELARRVKVFFALGPVTTITHATSPLVTFARLPNFILSQPWVTAFITLLLSLQSRIDTYVAHFPAGAAVQNVIHWHQVQPRTDYFSLLFFLQPTASREAQRRTPVAVWSGGRDKFADPKDMAKLLPQISNLIYHEHFPSWGHLDFVWGLDATEKMYLKII
uniref:Partial AB-hydrolase lipase domain-containing protein n=1 Tax=Calidris pygmaea TaxID=425635 RepID=A0A8C3KLL7_9CHAR